MDEDLEQRARDVLAEEQFGVLATAAAGRLHTATILFAASPDWELVFAIRPPTLKAQLAYIAPRVAFQVDNRRVTATDREAFVRIGFEGTLARLERGSEAWQHGHDLFAAKFTFGADLLAQPEIELHLLMPALMRVAVGAHAPTDIEIPAPPPPPASEPVPSAEEPAGS